MRAKGLFVTFYNEVLIEADVRKYNIFTFTRRNMQLDVIQ